MLSIDVCLRPLIRSILQADNDSDAEDEIDAALEDLLDAHMDCSENEDCSESESADSFHGGGGASGLSDDADRMEAFFGLKSKATSSGRKRKIEGGSEDGGSKRARAVDASGRADDATEDTSRGPPANFSRVVSSLPEDKLRENFPKFLESRRRQLDVTLVAGEMLYLPCGWFHEVTSKSSQGASVPASQQFHMAVNYWFHPPDGDSFKSPYADTFWSESWKRRKLD